MGAAAAGRVASVTAPHSTFSQQRVSVAVWPRPLIFRVNPINMGLLCCRRLDACVLVCQCRRRQYGQELWHPAAADIMTRTLNRLTSLKVAREKAPGMYADGGSLYLRVAPGG